MPVDPFAGLWDPSFWKAAALGFSIAAPIGPVGALCMSRSLTGGAALGLATGLGASTTHVVWALVAASWAATAIRPGSWPSVALSAAGAILMLTTGVLMARRRTSLAQPSGLMPTRLAVLGAYGSGSLIAAANPTTLLLFLGAMPALSLRAGAGDPHAVTLAAGIFLGSALWWLMLSAAVARMQTRLTQSTMRLVNCVSGCLLIALALLLLVQEVASVLACPR